MLVPYRGRLRVRWKAGGKHGARTKELAAGRRTVLLKTPRRAGSVYVSVSLTPSP